MNMKSIFKVLMFFMFFNTKQSKIKNYKIIKTMKYSEFNALLFCCKRISRKNYI